MVRWELKREMDKVALPQKKGDCEAAQKAMYMRTIEVGEALKVCSINGTPTFICTRDKAIAILGQGDSLMMSGGSANWRRRLSLADGDIKVTVSDSGKEETDLLIFKDLKIPLLHLSLDLTFKVLDVVKSPQQMVEKENLPEPPNPGPVRRFLNRFSASQTPAAI
jgi:hypothetical protein